MRTKNASAIRPNQTCLLFAEAEAQRRVSLPDAEETVLPTGSPGGLRKRSEDRNSSKIKQGPNLNAEGLYPHT